MSRQAENSTSVLRQREIIENWAKANDHQIVAWAEDVDVSGSLSPFEAPALAPYLTDEGKETWDIMVAWKLDRVARRSIPLHHLFGWLQDNDKTLVCVADNIDLSTWVGRMVAGVIAGVAEGELEAISARAKAGAKKSRELGRWTGGPTPYARRPVEKEGGGWKLEWEPKETKTLKEIIERVKEGNSLNSIALDLTARKVPPPTKRGTIWRHEAIKKILTNQGLMGWYVHEGRPVLDDEGKPILLNEPLLTAEEFYDLQEIISKRAIKKKKKSEYKESPLLHVLKCWYCGANMFYQIINRKNGGVYTSYYCGKRCELGKKMVRGSVVEEQVNEIFLVELGRFQVKKKVTTLDNSYELEEAQAAYKELAEFLPTAPDSNTRQMLMEQLAVIGNRIKGLETQKAPGTSWEDTGETYADVWSTLDEQGRRKFLVDNGITVRVRQVTAGKKGSAGVIQTEFLVPEELKKHLN